jgi:NHL repeat
MGEAGSAVVELSPHLFNLTCWSLAMHQTLLYRFLYATFCSLWMLNVLQGAPRAELVIGEKRPAGAKTIPKGVLDTPFGADFDARGNMYLVELSGGRVFKQDTSGNLMQIAGDGSKSYSGDGGPAKHATFNGMHNIAVTPAGDLYIADSWNHCIRKIDAKTSIITTIAGTGEPGYTGEDGPAGKAQFNFIMCITLNHANDKIYIADLKNRRVRVVDLKSGIVSLVAGNGEKGVPRDGSLAVESPLIDPRAVAVDSKNNVYILERGGNALRKVTPSGRIRTVAGTGKRGKAVGAALETEFGSPKHLAIDHNDNVLIADEANARILKYDVKANTIVPILGAGVTNLKRTLFQPHGVTVHVDGTIYITDSGNHRVLRLVK